MKLINKSIYVLSLASMLGLWSCSADEEVPGMGNTGKPVPLTITVSRDGVQTRTELSENAAGGLSDKWLADDELKIYDSNGNEAGTLTLESGADNATAVFAGTLTSGTSGEYRLWYFGQPVEGGNPNLELTQDNKVNRINLANQSFKSAKDLSALDIMSKKVNITVSGGVARVAESITMEPQLAMARFELTGIDGKSGNLVITNPGNNEGMLYAKQLNLSNPASSENIFSQTDGINVLIDGNGGDVYVAFAPSAYTLKFTFTTTDGDVYVYQFEKSTTLEAGKYYCSWTEGEGASGVEIPLVKEDPNNPGDMDSWGGGDEPQGPTYSEFPVTGKTKNGWCVDGRFMYPDQFFGKGVTYTNGIKNTVATVGYNSASVTEYTGTGSVLCSNESAFDAIYYQWGRSMGFPSTISTLIVNPVWGYQEYNSLTKESVEITNWLNGVSSHSGKYGYNNTSADETIWDAFYAIVPNNTKYPINTVAKINDFGIIYFEGKSSGNRDYYTGSGTLTTLEARGGDPCPAGYRMPKAEELEVLIPSTGKFTGSCSEIKEVKGSYYAMQWVVTPYSNTNLPYVTIKSVKVGANTNLSSVDFSKASSVKLGALGYITNSGNFAILSDGYYMGLYWTSDYVPSSGRVKYLEVDIKNNNVEMSLFDNGSPSWGCCVLPIKDKTATGQGSIITPLLPLYEIN